MNATTAKRRLEELELAPCRLEEALTVPETAPLAIDGTIPRFEFVFELCWKVMKALAELHTPSVNASTHAYREATAKDVYRRVQLRTPMVRLALPELRGHLP
jgi:hypothetical protein